MSAILCVSGPIWADDEPDKTVSMTDINENIELLRSMNLTEEQSICVSKLARLIDEFGRQLNDDLFQAKCNSELISEAYNRKWVETWFTEHFNSFRVESYTVLAIDLDKFKSINETFDHVQADQILKRFGTSVNQYLAENTRDNTSFFIHSGGDEFLIFLLNTPEEREKTIAQGIVDMVSGDASLMSGLQKVTPEEAGEFYYASDYLSMSVGVYRQEVGGIFLNDAEVASVIESGRRISDKALYSAKNNGRNQVYFYKPGICDKAFTKKSA